MQTIADLYSGYFARPDVIERSKSAETRGIYTEYHFYMMASSIGLECQRVANLPPSVGYAPWFIEHGVEPTIARGLAQFVIQRGQLAVKEAEGRRAVVAAIRFLQSPHRRKSAAQRRARLLLTAWEQTSIIDKIFAKAGLNLSEFLSDLKLLAKGDESVLGSVSEIAVSLRGHLSVPPGRKVSLASAAHEAFLDDIGRIVGRTSYTWSDVSEDYTDSATAATRTEFSDYDFSPASAARRLKKNGGIFSS